MRRPACLLAALIFTQCALRSQTPPQFTATDLGVLPGFAISQATGLASNGAVVGYSSTGNFSFEGTYAGPTGKAQGWIYANGKLTPLPGSAITIPFGINAAGEVVGITTNPAWPTDVSVIVNFDPFLYINGQYNTPPALLSITQPCGSCQQVAAEPVGIADTGLVALQVAPEINSNLYGSAWPYQLAGVWNGSQVTQFLVPGPCEPIIGTTTIIVGNNPDFCVSNANGISRNGQYVAGSTWFRNAGYFEPTVWTNGQPRTYGQGGTAVGVNNLGIAVGVHGGSATEFNPDGTTTSLGSGWSPTGINSTGWVVGYTANYLGPANLNILPVEFTIQPSVSSSVLWIAGKQYNLASLVTNAAGWTFDLAYAINDSNQIIGTGFHNGVQTAFLLSPGAAGPPAPAITHVVNAEGGASTIAANTWVEIDGTNLSTTTRTWQDSDFLNGIMPTALSGVSVTMNGEKVFVYYVSATQINVLTPPDLAAGTVQVVVTANAIASAPAAAQAQAQSPSFFIFNGGHDVVAVHADGSLIGPPTLFPGQSTPAKAGETILIFANGFGAIAPPVTSGSEHQSGSLPALPQVTIGGVAAQVTFAGLISPGLYQFNVVVPSSAAAGDNSISATYNGVATQGGTVLSIQ